MADGHGSGVWTVATGFLGPALVVLFAGVFLSEPGAAPERMAAGAPTPEQGRTPPPPHDAKLEAAVSSAISAVDDENLPLPTTDEALVTEDASEEIVRESLAEDILNAVEYLAKNKKALGYNEFSFFTETLAYGEEEIKGVDSPRTMCVGAVAEIMIRAVDAWSRRNNSDVAYEELGPNRWVGSKMTDLRPWLFVWDLKTPLEAYEGRTYGSGTHDAIVLFGLGEPVTFETAQPGDFINFNRTYGSGHAAVFLGYLKDNEEFTLEYDEDVIGFRYFSAQQSGVAGLDYRNAYFHDVCPEKTGDYRRDCNILRSDTPDLMAMARLYTPDHWRADNAEIFIRYLVQEGMSFDDIASIRYRDEVPLMPKSEPFFDKLLTTDLEPVSMVSFDGVTLD